MAGGQGCRPFVESGRRQCQDNTQGRPQLLYENDHTLLQFDPFPGIKCSNASSVVAPFAAGRDRALRVVRRFLASKDTLLQL